MLRREGNRFQEVRVDLVVDDLDAVASQMLTYQEDGELPLEGRDSVLVVGIGADAGKGEFSKALHSCILLI